MGEQALGMTLPAGTYVVAVSGGVDSVVLLDLAARCPEVRLVVAHFDHGIREDSAADARFVRALAARYGLPYEERREALGNTASELTARTRRYAFLREVTARHAATLLTAHHLDDMVETIAINLIRGTGWRGLAVLGAHDIERPLLGFGKAELLAYATAHRLEWVEDETNRQAVYLRNRLRYSLAVLGSDTKFRLAELRAAQMTLRAAVEVELRVLIPATSAYSRYFFIMCPPVAAQECLRVITRARLTRPQLERLLLVVKGARTGTRYEAGAGVSVRFTKRDFFVELP